MLTFNNRTFEDLLRSLRQDAINEGEHISGDAIERLDPSTKAKDIVLTHKPLLPELDTESIWVDPLEIRSTSNPRVQLEFNVSLKHKSKFLINYQPTPALTVPISVSESSLIFTYSVCYNFDPEETRTHFRSDLESVRQYLQNLETKTTAWSTELTAELAAQIRKRQSPTKSLAAKIEELGYPTTDPRE